MKKRISKLIIMFITMSIIISIVSRSNAAEEQEKQKIEDFINEYENLIFAYHNYSKASEIPLTDEWGIPEGIARKYGTLVETEDSEILKITKGFKAYSFKKEDADKYLKEKLGITFDELNDYKLYEKTHTTSTDKNVYYHITEGYGTAYPEYKVNSVKALENGNIEVEIQYFSEDINIVTLKQNGESYLFVSVVNDNEDYEISNKPNDDELKEEEQEKQKIEDFINEYENLIFAYHNYSKASEIPLTDEWGIPEGIARKYGTLVETEDSEVLKITKGFKAYSFKKEDADKYLKEKLGIAFDELNDYNSYEKAHTTSTDKNVYYHITEGYGTAYPEYKVNSVKTLENGNIEVEVSYVYTDYVREDNGNKYTIYTYEKSRGNIVTLKPTEGSYLFVSCTKNFDKTLKLIDQHSYESEDTNKPSSDKTTATGKIPQTGESITIVIAIVMLGILATIGIIKFRKSRF